MLDQVEAQQSVVAGAGQELATAQCQGDGIGGRAQLTALAHAARAIESVNRSRRGHAPQPGFGLEQLEWRLGAGLAPHDVAERADLD